MATVKEKKAKTKDAKPATLDEIHTRLLGLKKTLMNLRFQKGAGQLKDTSAMSKARKEVARLQTAAHAQVNHAQVKKTASKKVKKTGN